MAWLGLLVLARVHAPQRCCVGPRCRNCQTVCGHTGLPLIYWVCLVVDRYWSKNQSGACLKPSASYLVSVRGPILTPSVSWTGYIMQSGFKINVFHSQRAPQALPRIEWIVVCRQGPIAQEIAKSEGRLSDHACIHSCDCSCTYRHIACQSSLQI